MIKEFVKNILFNLKKNKSTFSPVFIIGCGRSGTTILGNTLAQHPDIKYRRYIKRKNPETKKTKDKSLYLIGGDILNKTIDNSYTL